jgi:Skp family chaperone for outer membrane proteins
MKVPMPHIKTSPPSVTAAGTLSAVLALVSATVLSACATPVPPPTDAVTTTTAVLAQATGAGGDVHAAQEMQSARNKLQRAQSAMSASEHALALTLLHEAQMDARLAEAKAQSAKARQRANAARESNRVLSEEIQRKTP